MTKLADEAARQAFLFFWNESNPQTGLTKDRAKTLDSGDEYNVASIAATGYAQAALAIGAERGWKKKSEARARTAPTFRPSVGETLHARIEQTRAHLFDAGTERNINAAG